MHSCVFPRSPFHCVRAFVCVRARILSLSLFLSLSLNTNIYTHKALFLLDEESLGSIKTPEAFQDYFKTVSKNSRYLMPTSSEYFVQQVLFFIIIYIYIYIYILEREPERERERERKREYYIYAYVCVCVCVYMFVCKRMCDDI